jgi:hypothetical protein
MITITTISSTRVKPVSAPRCLPISACASCDPQRPRALRCHPNCAPHLRLPARRVDDLRVSIVDPVALA